MFIGPHDVTYVDLVSQNEKEVEETRKLESSYLCESSRQQKLKSSVTLADKSERGKGITKDTKVHSRGF